MVSCFERSHAAYEARDGALAKELSNEGKAHQHEMERLNAEASEWIFIGTYRHDGVISSEATGNVYFFKLHIRVAVCIGNNFLENNKVVNPSSKQLNVSRMSSNGSYPF